MDIKIDAFAHVLPTDLLNNIKSDFPDVIEKNQFLKIPALTDLNIRRKDFPKDVKQIISNVNLNPEDYFDGKKAAQLCWDANEELVNYH